MPCYGPGLCLLHQLSSCCIDAYWSGASHESKTHASFRAAVSVRTPEAGLFGMSGFSRSAGEQCSANARTSVPEAFIRQNRADMVWRSIEKARLRLSATPEARPFPYGMRFALAMRRTLPLV